MSANAACSKRNQGNQGILQGLPRPTDIAPPGQVPSFRCSAGKINERRHRTMAFQTSKFRRNNLEDVFYAPDYLESGKRRHSIGTYLNGEVMGSKGVLKITSVPSEVPTMDPPVFFKGSLPRMRRVPADFSTRTVQTVTTLLRQEPPSPKISTPTHTLMSTSRKKRNRRTSNKEMEDIVIIYSAKSTEGQLWCDYLSSCFDKMMSQRARQHYRVMPWTVEEILVDDEQSLKSRGMVSSAKLQVVVLCPKLLDSITRIIKDGYPLKSMMKSEKVLSMLLGVSVETLEKDTDATTISYQEWQKMEINEQNTTIVENFLSAAVSILSRKAVVKSASDKAGFSIVPKKIKMGQNRVIALLNEPVTNDDNITVSVDKAGDIIPINSFKKRNPYTLQFDVPDCCLEVSMLIWIKIDKNGVPLGSRQIKCESRLRELDQILRASDNPMEFMCQTLGFKTSDRDQLDTWMLSSFQKNIPPHFSLLSTPQINTKTSPSMDEYPTLLHFAARFGLEKLCWQLLECPGGDVASDIRNVRHLTPADLAHSAGFTELSVVLRGFMQMNEFSNMYYYLKNISEDDPKPDENKDTTEIRSPTPVPNNTDPFSDICLQNLEPQAEVPILRVALPPVKHYDQLYENDSVINKTCNDTIQKALENDYLIQPSNIKVELPKHPIIPNQYTGTPVNASHHPVFIYSPSEETKPFIPNESTHQKDKISLNSFTTKSTHSSGQDELAEIINDFKNNVFTINEVEKLVMDWRNRNETTQSLKEKQEQLDRMRREYERLQKKIKEDLKRPTPFERIKKIFSKGKSKSSRKSGIAEQTPLTSALRPNSRLSVQSESSSSSGRLSTVSGTSIGENTLQPESDDKKVSLFQLAEKPVTMIPEATKSDLNDDYLIPPPPRPLGFEVCMLDFHQPIETKPESQSGNDMPAPVYCHQFLETQSSEENKNKTAHLYMNISPQ